MKTIHFLLAIAILALATFIASAYDPSPLQDYCVLDRTRKYRFVNGDFCKDPYHVSVSDFFASGFNASGNTNNSFGSSVTVVNLDKIPGLNTLGISLSRIDYAPSGGQNPPHFHPRGSELLAVAFGSLSVGFVSSNQDNNRLFTKILNQGDVFVIPVGMVHFEVNIGKTPAVAFTVFNSQNAGVITLGSSVFGSHPPINPDFLAKAFKLDRSVVINLQRQFG